MTNEVATCLFCDNQKDKKTMIEGMNGYLCTECLTVCHSLNDIIEPNNKERDSKINIREIKKKLDTQVVGHEDVKKQLITEVYKHYNQLNKAKNNILLVGDSGVGKTYIMRSLAQLLGVPFLEVDATAFSETGYKGRDATDMLDDLISQEEGNKETIEQAIVFIDEIDKITSTHSGEPNVKIQHALLKIIEGTTYHYDIGQGRNALQGSIDTANILFVGAGACVGLNGIRTERSTPRRSIGFRQELQTTKEINDYTSQDLIDFGFIPELIGRFSLVLELQALTESNIRYLLVEHADSPIKHMQRLCAREGIALLVDDDSIESLVQASLDHPLGVRNVSHELTKRLNTYLFDALMDNVPQLYLSDIVGSAQQQEGHIPEL